MEPTARAAASCTDCAAWGHAERGGRRRRSAGQGGLGRARGACAARARAPTRRPAPVEHAREGAAARAAAPPPTASPKGTGTEP